MKDPDEASDLRGEHRGYEGEDFGQEREYAYRVSCTSVGQKQV